MSFTSRRKRPLDRTISHLRDTALIVIAVEGRQTEKQYFEAFRGYGSRVQVKVLETQDGLSSPKHVLARLRRYKRDTDVAVNDQLWLVVDKDRWGDRHLAQVSSETRRLRFNLAVSTPCFELWLYLHHADPTSEMSGKGSQYLKQKLRELLGGYDESNLQIDQFLPHTNTAIGRAEKLDTRPDDRWPNELGTHVYRLVKVILL